MIHEISEGVATIDTRYLYRVAGMETETYSTGNRRYRFSYYMTTHGDPFHVTYDNKDKCELARKRLISAWRQTPYLTKDPVRIDTPPENIAF